MILMHNDIDLSKAVKVLEPISLRDQIDFSIIEKVPKILIERFFDISCINNEYEFIICGWEITGEGFLFYYEVKPYPYRKYDKIKFVVDNGDQLCKVELFSPEQFDSRAGM